MTTIEKSVDVTAPVSTVYNQWTQFESFPAFMDGVDRIVQVTPTRNHWETTIGGVHREFDTEITEQHPDERIAWKYEPESLRRRRRPRSGVIAHRIDGDPHRFKEFIESKGHETGAGRGAVQRPPQQGDGPAAAGPGPEPPGHAALKLKLKLRCDSH
ncbi:SRPBCC family protein [Actinokineospora sp.]|uniref:SRPBCC family protein n=1 Tax=Actinokineospora sp. TaxID=1872133 RepID=UPI003D6A71D0